MADNPRLQGMLDNENPGQNIQAREKLEVNQSLPPEAIEAPELLTIDGNQAVPGATQQALAFHVWLLIGILIGLLANFVGLSAYFGLGDMGNIFLCSPFFLLFSVLGAFIGRRTIINAISGAVLGGILGIGLFPLFFESLTLWFMF